MPDWSERIAALRRLGAEGSGATDHERKLANDKADELEAKYGTVTENSTFTDDTTVTSRDGFVPPGWRPADKSFWDELAKLRKEEEAQRVRDRDRKSWETLWDLHRQQPQWNRPPRVPDEYTLYEEAFKYAPEEED